MEEILVKYEQVEREFETIREVIVNRLHNIFAYTKESKYWQIDDWSIWFAEKVVYIKLIDRSNSDCRDYSAMKIPFEDFQKEDYVEMLAQRYKEQEEERLNNEKLKRERNEKLKEDREKSEYERLKQKFESV